MYGDQTENLKSICAYACASPKYRYGRPRTADASEFPVVPGCSGLLVVSFWNQYSYPGAIWTRSSLTYCRPALIMWFPRFHVTFGANVIAGLLRGLGNAAPTEPW